MMKLRNLLAAVLLALATAAAPISAVAQSCDDEGCYCDYLDCYLPNYCDDGRCSATEGIIWCDGTYEGSFVAGCCYCT